MEKKLDINFREILWHRSQIENVLKQLLYLKKKKMTSQQSPFQYCSAIINTHKADQPVKGWLPCPLPVLSLYCSQI